MSQYVADIIIEEAEEIAVEIGMEEDVSPSMLGVVFASSIMPYLPITTMEELEEFVAGIKDGWG